MKSFDFLRECRPWREKLQNAKSEKRGAKCKKSGAKYSAIHFLHFALIFAYLALKPAIHLSFLAFRHVRALFRELFREIANQSLYTSHNNADFVHLWFCEKVDEKLDECMNSSLKNLRSSKLIRTLKICKNFYRKIWRFLQESLTIFNRKIVSFPIKTVKRSCKNQQNFLEKS